MVYFLHHGLLSVSAFQFGLISIPDKKVWLCPSGSPSKSCRLTVEGEHFVSYQRCLYWSKCSSLCELDTLTGSPAIGKQWPCPPFIPPTSDCSSPAAVMGRMILISPPSSIISSVSSFRLEGSFLLHKVLSHVCQLLTPLRSWTMKTHTTPKVSATFPQSPAPGDSGSF